MMAGNGLPGFALGVVKDGALAYAHGYGVAGGDFYSPTTPVDVMDMLLAQ